jgi:hypothetical protein
MSIEPPTVQSIARIDVLWSHSLSEQPGPSRRNCHVATEQIDRARSRDHPPEQYPSDANDLHRPGGAEHTYEERHDPGKEKEIITVIKEPEYDEEQALHEAIQ